MGIFNGCRGNLSRNTQGSAVPATAVAPEAAHALLAIVGASDIDAELSVDSLDTECKRRITI